MSSTKRKKEAKVRKVRTIIAVCFLAASMVVMIWGIREYMVLHATNRIALYGFIMFVLWFMAGYVGGPVLQHWKENTRKLDEYQSAIKYQPKYPKAK